MSFAMLRLSALCTVLALAVGCGGSVSSNGDGAGDSSTTVSFTISGATPTAVATRVGAGSFTAAIFTSGVVNITVPSGQSNFAFAYVCPPLSGSGTGNQQFVFEASTVDGSSFTGNCPEPPSTPASATLTGSVDAVAIPGASYLEIYAEGSGAVEGSFLSIPGSSFSLPAPPGADRVLVLTYSGVAGVFSAEPVNLSLLAARNFENQAAPGALNGGNSIVLGLADETIPEAITYGNIPSGFGAPAVSAELSLGGGGGVTLLDLSANPTEYPALPAGSTETGDSYLISSSVLNGDSAMAVQKTFTAAGPVAFTFPSPWSYAGPTPASLPTVNFAYTGFSGPVGVDDEMEISWPGIPGGSQYLYKVTATATSLSGSTRLTFLDLSGVPGFLTPPASGDSVTWDANLFQYSPTFVSSPPANETVTSVSNGGTYTVP